MYYPLAGGRNEGEIVRINAKEKMVVLAIRGVTAKDKRSLLRIARREGLNTLSALLRREIKRLVKAQGKAA